MPPLLDPMLLPQFADLTPEKIDAALDVAVADHRNVIADLVARRPKDFFELWLPYERANNAIEALWSAVSHLGAVADNPPLREAKARAQSLIVANSLNVRQNRDFFDALTDMRNEAAFAAMSLEDRAAVDRELRSFRLSGVALGEEARLRFSELSLRLSDLSNQFSNAVLDASEAWYEHISDERLLAGVSDADKAMLASAARARSLDGWAVTLQQPSIQAVMRFAENADLRARVYEAYGTRASDRGPHARQFDNSRRMNDILSLRREMAHLLGYSDPVAWSLETKMAQSADEVLTFLRDLAVRARPFAERELAETRQFAAHALGLDVMHPSDMAFVSQRLRESRYAIDEGEVRAYFPVDAVLAGWADLLNILFGITLQEFSEAPRPHPEAIYYDVLDETGTVIGGLYVDLHARAGKRGGAWMAPARPKLNDGNIQRVPVSYLTCNFAPRQGETPALLAHHDIVTLLHETGHALHHVLTNVKRPSVAGTGGFEWDAIELPSQLLEDFAWDSRVLTSMSRHVRTSAQLPAELFAKLLAARDFQSGLEVLRQVEFAMADLLLHAGTLGSDPVKVFEAVRDEIAVVRPPEWHRFPHAFTHIFSGAYASGYYSYLWAEVLAADGFARFEEAGLLDRATGDALRDEILSRGATRPAAESFYQFRGREPDATAMLKRRGLSIEDVVG